MPSHVGALRRRSGFTLVELLVVIAIIAVLLAILLPTLKMARENGKRVKCMSNMRQIAIGQSMYMEDNGPLVPWVNPHPSASWRSQFVWGGFIAPNPDPYFGNNIDYMKWGADERPLSKYVAPDASRYSTPEVYICPGDRTRGYGIISGGSFTLNPNDTRTSWGSAGNSYAVNWFWMDYYKSSWHTSDMEEYNRQMMPDMVGGKASEFIVYYESLMHNIMQDSTYNGQGVQRFGWHYEFSKHVVDFLDGHSEYRFMDTRYPYGNGWTIWPKRGRPEYMN